VLQGEIGLLVVPAAVAAFVHGLGEEPARAQAVVEGDHRRAPDRLPEQVDERLHEVVGLHRTPGHAHDRDARPGPPAPAQVVRQAHRPRRVALHGVDAPVGGARPGRDDRPGPGRQPVDPLARRDRPAARAIRPHRGPVPLAGERFVRHGALDDEDERPRRPPLGCATERLEKRLAGLVGEERVVQRDRRQVRDGAQDDVLEARLRGRGHRHAVTVAAERGRQPENVELVDRRGVHRAARSRSASAAGKRPRPSLSHQVRMIQRRRAERPSAARGSILRRIAGPPLRTRPSNHRPHTSIVGPPPRHFNGTQH
jgi:hypothetical protein